MKVDLLKRNLAPLLPEAWAAVDEEARRVLVLNLGGRKLVDFSGPFGWKFASVNTGKLILQDAQIVPDVKAGLREVQPLVELRTPIVLDLMELDSVARGATAPDLSSVVTAAERIARAEDTAIFHGYAAGHIRGMIESSPHAPISVGAAEDWPRAVSAAKDKLKEAGIGGPYALAVGSAAFDEITAGSQDGYPLKKRIDSLIDGGLVRAPSLKGGVLVSTRGGDFELSVGQDLSVGYAFHDRSSVELYLTESFTFRVLEGAAAVALTRP
jgi:uncharacterized linocin/CFP29 family protein